MLVMYLTPKHYQHGRSVHRASNQATVPYEMAAVRVVALRRAVRALVAYAVRPAPPSPGDAHRLMPLDEALRSVNVAAARATSGPAPRPDACAASSKSTGARTSANRPAATGRALPGTTSGIERQRTPPIRHSEGLTRQVEGPTFSD